MDSDKQCFSPNNRNGIETGGGNSNQFLIVKNRMERLGGSSADLISSEYAVTTVYCIGHFRCLGCDTIPIFEYRTHVAAILWDGI